jgi:nucleotide-binding universal stress UspA family protein
MAAGDWEKILVPTDFSKHSENAVQAAHRLAERLGAELHVLFVARDSEELGKQLPFTGVLERGDEDEANQYLASLLGETMTVKRVQTVRMGPDVVATINQYVEEKRIDLIVMATHGRTGLSYFLHGSVTEQVIQTSNKPVLVVKG